MRPRIACLLAMLVAVGFTATATADDNNSQQSHGIFPIFRPHTKPATQTAVQAAASESVLTPPPANEAAAPATIVVSPATGTPYINLSDPDGGYSTPRAYPFAVCHQGRVGQREVDFLGCVSVQGYWRFFCGGARSYWREGRHEPDTAKGCYCGSR
jgi:hypothetical protein